MYHEALVSHHACILVPFVGPARLGGLKPKEIEFVDILREFKLPGIVRILNYHLYLTL